LRRGAAAAADAGKIGESGMIAESALMAEVEYGIASASTDRRGEMARQLTDLFLDRGDEFSADDLSVFDEVIVRLVAAIEVAARALLAKRLAPLRNSPPQAIRALAFDDAIEVAGPVLAQSLRLDDRTLIEIARSKGQEHLFAISQRSSLSEAVTDVLVEVGDRDVVLSTVDNYGATLSDLGFSLLVSRAESDDTLAEFVGSRPEIPAHLLTTLVAKASTVVRSKLEAAHPRAKAEVRRAVAEAAMSVEAQTLAAEPDYAAALISVENLRRSGRLGEQALSAFAKAGAYAETIAALAAMAAVPLSFIQQCMGRDPSETLMVVAKALELSRTTVEHILSLRAGKGFIVRHDIAQRLARFERLQASTAEEILQVYRSRAQTKTTFSA
jgi:uncharacterized protein (DUF2336 family)